MKKNYKEANQGLVVILGNGFDIDLGYPTRYQDFVNNDNPRESGGFPFVRGGNDYNALGKYVLDAAIRQWYDLENVLSEYGELHKYSSKTDGDKEDYLRLIQALSLYLSSIDYSHPKRDSVAALLWNSFKDSKSFPFVYSFNYTNLSKIGGYIGLGIAPIFHVHGSLDNNDIILGVGDYSTLSNSTDFLYKTSNPKYKSTRLLDDLDTCRQIIFFGQSLSKVDYPYFEGFFKKVAMGEYVGDRKKYIRIFTYDESSRMNILRNLRNMNKGMIALSNYSDFDIIRTKDNMDQSKVEDVISRLKGDDALGATRE